MPGINKWIPTLNNQKPTGIKIIVQQHANPIPNATKESGTATNNQIQAEIIAPVNLKPIPSIHHNIAIPIKNPNISIPNLSSSFLWRFYLFVFHESSIYPLIPGAYYSPFALSSFPVICKSVFFVPLSFITSDSYTFSIFIPAFLLHTVKYFILM